MTRLATIIALVLMAAIIAAESTMVVTIDAPGSAGMVSAYDPVGTMGDNHARLLLNVTTELGNVQKRRELDTVGGNTISLLSAMGYWNWGSQNKQVVATSADSSGVAGLAQIHYSDAAGFDLGNWIDGPPFMSSAGRTGWVAHKNLAVAYNEYSLPAIFTTDVGVYYDSTESDSSGYSARAFVPLAPGQLGAGLVGDIGDGDLTGAYEYRVRFHAQNDSSLFNFPICGNTTMRVSRPGPASNVVYPRNQNVVLTYFPRYPDYTAASWWTTIERRSITGRRGWHTLARIEVDTVAGFYYIDDKSDADLIDTYAEVADTMIHSSCTLVTAIIDSFPVPGGMIPYGMSGSAADTITADDAAILSDDNSGLLYAFRDSTYYFQVAHLDPATGIESPLGPATAGRMVYLTTSGGGADSSLRAALWRFPRVNTTERPDWLRLYQNVRLTGLVGSGDTSFVYAILDVRAEAEGGIYAQAYTIKTGEWPDARVTVGLDTDTLYLNLVYDYQYPTDFFGNILSRPPYLEGNDKCFSTMAYSMGRFWGAGDDGCQTCVYYSEIDSAHLWPAINFVDLGTDRAEEVVAVVPAMGNTGLYAFMSNTIWMAYGFDPVYDFSIRQISNGIGAVSKDLVVVGRDSRGIETIYFMSPELKIYSLTEFGPPVEISQPIEDWVLAIFDTSYDQASAKGRGFRLGESVKWQCDSCYERHLAFSFSTGIWSLEQYQDADSAAYVPRGSFAYDTSSRTLGFPDFSDYIYTANGEALRHEALSQTKIDASYRFPWAYQTKYYGRDGLLWWLQEIQLTAQVPPDGDTTRWCALYYRIYNEKEDSVAGDFVVVSSDNSADIILQPPQHVGKYLSIELYGRGNEALATNTIFNQMILSQLQLTFKSAGQSAVSDSIHTEIQVSGENPWEAHDGLGNPSN